MYKKIDTEILRRYIEGTATASEKMQVELWMKNSSSDSVENVFESDEEKEKVKSEIWHSLEKRSHSHFSKQTNIRIGKRTLYLISSAACIIGIIISLYTILIPKNQSDSKTVFCEKTVRFCENTRLDVEENTKVTFIADCDNGGIVKHTVLCKKGETYFAIKGKSNTNGEIFIVAQRDLQELPRDIRIALHKEALL